MRRSLRNGLRTIGFWVITVACVIGIIFLPGWLPVWWAADEGEDG